MQHAPGRGRRILLVAPQPFYQDRGTPIAVGHVLKTLSDAGCQVDVLTLPIGSSPEMPGVRYLRVANALRIRAVPVGFSFRKLWFDGLLWGALRRQLRRERYDAVHAVEEAAFLAVLAARRRVPVIYDMQSSLAEQMAALPLFRHRLGRALLTLCERWLIRHADAVVCSTGLAERVRQLVPDARIQEWRYPNPLPAALPEEVERLRTSLQLQPGQPVVVYTGTFEAYQGLQMLVDAIPLVRERHPNTVFVFVGALETSGELGRLLAARLPDAAYRLVPRQPRERIPAFFALADVVVSPRAFGGNLPLKVLEYLAAGCAIVATDIPAHRAILNEQLALLAVPTVPGLADALNQLVGDPALARQLRRAAQAFAWQELGWDGFRRFVTALYGGLWRRQPARATPEVAPSHIRTVSVIVPARNAAAILARPLQAVRAQAAGGMTLDLVVVDDGSTDSTAELAKAQGARVIRRTITDGGNPAAARNIGAAAARGELLVFLDADCTPGPGWLPALLAAHARGAVCVGGSLALPPGLPATARWDYYCGWYHVHPQRRATWVTQHPPCNLSIRRDLFLQTCGFDERQPIAYAHEELAWQAELKRQGLAIYFEPAAVVAHANRPGLGQLLRRNYRWAYSAIESKAASGIVRVAWLYRWPWLAVFLGLPTAPLQAAYVIRCWLRAGVLEPLLVWPVVLAARLAYGAGMTVGGARWLLGRPRSPFHSEPAVPRSAFSPPPPRDAGDVTAAICTRNRPELLERALQSLLEQAPAPAEILVVDNAPSDDRAQAIVARHDGRVRYVHEPVPGLDVARNRALQEARAPIVAFLDDDAVAHSGWSGAFAQSFAASQRLLVCTGRVDALTVSTPAQRLFEANGGFSRGLQRLRLPSDVQRPLHGWPAPLIAWAVSVGSGASFAVRRDAVLALGGFDEALDCGERLPGGGDLDLFWRTLQAGHELVYEPAAVAWHDHRRSEAELARQLAGHQRALVAFLCKSAGQAAGRTRVDILVFLGWRLMKPGLRLVRRALGRDPLPAAVLWRMWGETWSGLTAYRPVRPDAAAVNGEGRP